MERSCPALARTCPLNLPNEGHPSAVIEVVEAAVVVAISATAAVEEAVALADETVVEEAVAQTVADSDDKAIGSTYSYP